MTFRVDLDAYRGPLDLLLYLVRKHEVDVADIPISLITNQYLAHLDVLEALDVDAVGEFLEMASTLIEIKSRLVLPHCGEEEETLEDPRQDLVYQLLEYKKYKDAASILEEQSRDWQKRYARLSDDLPPRRLDPAEQPIQEIELWDLVSAFGRIMRDSQATQPSNIVYDDTPIHVYMQRIHQRLVSDGRVSFSEMFNTGAHKSALIGVFLAVLELVRHYGVRTEQIGPHGEIWVLPTENFNAELDLKDVDGYEQRRPVEDDMPVKPR
jgi:segregation and condensation protein A